MTIKFKIANLAYWNDTTKNFDFDYNISMFNSVFTFYNDSTISVVMTNPKNNHLRKETYKWYTKTQKEEKGYNWIEYDLYLKKQSEFSLLSVNYNDNKEIIGISLANDKIMMLFHQK